MHVKYVDVIDTETLEAAHHTFAISRRGTKGVVYTNTRLRRYNQIFARYAGFANCPTDGKLCSIDLGRIDKVHAQLDGCTDHCGGLRFGLSKSEPKSAVAAASQSEPAHAQTCPPKCGVLHKISTGMR
jgi:hypothetical protein